MSIGIFNAWELVSKLIPRGTAGADRALLPTIEFWSRFGIEPDSSFLIRMGELCLSKAAELNKGGAAAPSAAEKEPTPGRAQSDPQLRLPPVMYISMRCRLRAYDRNARTHTRKQVRQIADSITEFGFTNPALIDDDDMISPIMAASLRPSC